jgi:hypothetical protein
MNPKGEIQQKNSTTAIKYVLLVPTSLFEQQTLACFRKIDAGRAEFDFPSVFYDAFELCAKQKYFNEFFKFDRNTYYSGISNDVTQPAGPSKNQVPLRYILTAKTNSKYVIVCSYNDIKNENINVNYNFKMTECVDQRNAK